MQTRTDLRQAENARRQLRSIQQQLVELEEGLSGAGVGSQPQTPEPSPVEVGAEKARERRAALASAEKELRDVER